MSYTIRIEGGSRPFSGPIARRISETGMVPNRYEILDEGGRSIAVFELSGAGLIAALEDRGFKAVGRLDQDADTIRQWGFSFGLERFEREKGFRAEILTGPYHSPNGGISAHAQFVTIVGDRVPEELRIHAVTSDAPAMRVADFPQRCLVPAEIPAGVIGPMASGAYAISGDSRWVTLTGGQGPIPLHDRFETPAQYAALSN